MAASENGMICQAWPPYSYCSTMNILLAIPLLPSISQCLMPPAQTLAGFLSMWRCSSRLSHSSAHSTSQGRRSSWRFLTTQHSPPAQSPQYLCSENGNWMALKAALFLANLHFSFLVSAYRYCWFLTAHSVTCWRTDTVSSRLLTPVS